MNLLILLIGVYLLPLTGQVSESTSKVQLFVDLDGDGFNDRATDQDTDGIPDAVDSERSKLETGGTTAEDFFSAGDLLPKTAVFLTNSSAFNHLKTSVAARVQSRGGFGSGSDFGPASGLGGGGVLGGACEGGVCRQ